MRVPPGFDPKNLLTFNISERPIDRGEIKNRLIFYDQAMARIRALLASDLQARTPASKSQVARPGV